MGTVIKEIYCGSYGIREEEKRQSRKEDCSLENVRKENKMYEVLLCQRMNDYNFLFFNHTCFLFLVNRKKSGNYYQAQMIIKVLMK